MRATTLVLALAIVGLAFTPVAAAWKPPAAGGPDCIQVYPWSKLCQGDVEGFLCAYGICLTP